MTGRPDKIEAGASFTRFAPHTEFFGLQGEKEHPFPHNFRQRFKKISESVYPQEPIRSMVSDGYNPVIIGYSHTNPAELEAISNKLAELKERSPDKTFSVLQEIDSQQLQWIRDFLKIEKEAKEKGTREGSSIPDEVEGMQDYRRRLQSNNAEFLSLWYLDNGIDVTSIEHPDVKKWIQSDISGDNFGDENESLGFTREDNLRPFYTAIKRDMYSIQLIGQHRPDLISVGALHALKYDMLLGRDGRNTFYYLDRPFEWSTIARHWEDVHERYANEKQR